MFSLIQFVPVSGDNVLLNGEDLIYPLEEFDTNIEFEGDDLAKMQDVGQWPNYKYPRKRIWTATGHILSDSTSQYWDRRKALLGPIVGSGRITPYGARQHGELHIQVDGDPNTYFSAVVLDDYEAPIAALYPTVTAFTFTWHAFDPFVRSVSDSNVILDI